jgi:NAD(P)-dependent dehydrogenase (short-subunit alcohol dehydrogenase family)
VTATASRLGPRLAIVTGAARNIGGKSGHAGANKRAHVIASLCHPDAGYVTGQTVHVNGGGYLP